MLPVCKQVIDLFEVAGGSGQNACLWHLPPHFAPLSPSGEAASTHGSGMSLDYLTAH
jgi:hypothetical protein